MEKQFATYEIALAVKELGFDEPCICYFYGGELQIDFINNINVTQALIVRFDEIGAPLWQQVIDWLFEKHNIVIQKNFIGYSVVTPFKMFGNRYSIDEAILKAIELIKNK